MNTIKKLGLTVRNRVVGLDIRDIDTTKYEPLKELIWHHLVKLESNTVSAQDNEDFYYKLVFWRNEVIDDKHYLYRNGYINTDGEACFNRLEYSIDCLMEEIPCIANYIVNNSLVC